MASIVIVDDKPTNRAVLIALLDSMGHQTIEASDGLEGLLLIDQNAPDLVITDLAMPNMNGYDFVRRLRENPKHDQMPIIFYTALYHQEEAKNLAQEMGVTHIITKPIEPQVVLETLTAALDSKVNMTAKSFTEPIERTHMNLALDKLAQSLDELSLIEMLISLGQQFASQKEMHQLLDVFCNAAQTILKAEYSVVGILSDDGETIKQVFTSGLDRVVGKKLEGKPSPAPILVSLNEQDIPLGLSSTQEDIRGNLCPLPGFPPAHSFLGITLKSVLKPIGWVFVANKRNEAAFSELDKRLITTLSTQLSTSYENVRYFNQQQNYTAELKAEVEEHRQTEAALALKADELLKANEELDEFASIASHDLKEPLRTITVYLQMLLKDAGDKLDQSNLDLIDQTIESTKNLYQLIHDLLEYARIGREDDHTIRPVDLGEILAEIRAALASMIDSTDAKITQDELPVVPGDHSGLSCVFQNLMTNAMKFTNGTPPEIHIGAMRVGDTWRISVQDNGIGIEPQYAERIFKAFQRLHSRKTYEGTGIGLAVCKKVIERHGGSIQLESEPGRGSVFHITLPAQEGGIYG